MKFSGFHRNSISQAWRTLAGALPLHPFRWRHDRMLRRAFHSGPPYRPSHRRIIIDITEECDLGCYDCSRSCGPGQAPSDGRMTLEQVDRFIRESREQGRKWEMIQVEGGEPTLHPGFLGIVSTLAEYIAKDSPRTVLQVNTNGYSPSARAALEALPRSVSVYNSAKTGRMNDEHLAFNFAPADIERFAGSDFSRGCCLPAMYGVGLTRYGYYPHPNCGGIDRVFGFDIGRRQLPLPGDGMEEQFPLLCQFCGLFAHFNRAVSGGCLPGKKPARGIEGEGEPGGKSESWRRAYRKYALEKPVLTEY